MAKSETDKSPVATRSIVRRIVEWVRGLPAAVRVLIVALCGFIALSGWAVSSPVGSSPDDDYHLASIWCATGDSAGCHMGEDGEAELARDLVRLSVCNVFDREESAACQGPGYGDLASDDFVTWMRGNYSEGLYPGAFYVFHRAFAGDDAVTSVWAMRLVNAFVFTATLTAAWLLLRQRERDALAWPLLVAATPLALFIVPSTNPSSWAFLGAFTVLPVAFGFVAARGRRRIGLGVLAALGVLLSAGARADAAGIAFLAVIAALVLAKVKLSDWRRYAWLPALSAVAAAVALLTSRQASALEVGLGSEPAALGLRAQLVSMARNITLWPDLVQGAVGGWGLGWLDTPMPFGVSVIPLLVLGAIVAAATRGAGRARALVLGVLTLAMIFYPLVLLARTGGVVGTYFQPRYLFPLLIMFIAAAVIPLGAKRISASRGQAIALALWFSFSAAISHYTLIRRYVTGTDGNHVSLDAQLEWWDFSASPMAVWIVSSAASFVVFGALASTVWTPAVREEDEAQESAASRS